MYAQFVIFLPSFNQSEYINHYVINCIIKFIMSHKHNITSKETQEYMEFDIYLLSLEDNNLLDYNQHQLMKREPNLVTVPNLVFLAPTMKGLRSPFLMCKNILARNHMALMHNQPLLCTSISAHYSAGQHYSSISGQSAHHC